MKYGFLNWTITLRDIFQRKSSIQIFKKNLFYSDNNKYYYFWDKLILLNHDYFREIYRKQYF